MRHLVTRISFPIALLAIAATSLLAAEPNRLTEAEQRSGWRLLFDGASLEGWRNFGQQTVSPGWSIENGTIVRKGVGAGDILSKETFGSFELQLEYKISKGGNSGLMFHVTEEERTPWMTGPEVQIQDNVDGHDPQKSGWLYQLYQPVKPAWAVRFEKQVGFETPAVDDATRPAGEWNHLYIRVTPTDGEVQVNGVSYFKFQKGSDDWNERVAKSKFADMFKFGKATEGHIALQDHGNEVAFRGIKVREIPADGRVPEPIDGTLENVKTVLAFPEIEWEGWTPVDERGKQNPPLRPIHVTHAGDGSGRLFVVDQSGMIHTIPTDGSARKATLWLDRRDQVHPFPQDDEEGFLGFAFHPRFAENGQFFAYYNPRFGEGTNVKPRTVRLSRFTVDPEAERVRKSEEEILLSFQQPFSNHNGGPMCFGNDGYLYVGFGDGGGRNDPMKLAQKNGSLMGTIIRVDVDPLVPGEVPYEIPEDNPFVGKENVRPEIYATGIRNPWRISCDPKTGFIWIADVGQDMWEEISVVTKPGQNFGWSIREGSKAFNQVIGDGGFSEPVWEYDHRVGKSITGGHVYRGEKIPGLSGHYLYGDYVSGKLWALHHDVEAGRTIRNVAIPWNGLPVLAFGEDEQGESYVTTPSQNGQSVYRIVK
jgi:glucose/arabinose dehydrogenase